MTTEVTELTPEEITTIKVREFRGIIKDKFESLKDNNSKGNARVLTFEGAYNVYYQRNLGGDVSYFTVENPDTDVSFEFITDEERGLVRNIFDSSKDRGYSDFDKDRLVASRVVEVGELDDLIAFMKDPDKFKDTGPPQSLIDIDPIKDVPQTGKSLPSWQPSHA